MNVIKNIPVDFIRPFDDQPRKHFDEQALRELADSIKTHGQYTPAWVVPLPCPLCMRGGREEWHEGECIIHYELIAGERRWRACGLAGIRTLVCEVREGLSVEQQYVASVMENFGRKDCTTMETARSVGKLLRQYKGDVAKTATVFARSAAWVQNINMLNRLEPDVAAMLEPPTPSLTTQVGIALANLRPEVQRSLAAEIRRDGMRHKAALAHIRNSITNEHRVRKQGMRGRKPVDDFNILNRFLESLGPQAQAIMDIGEDRMRAMFVHRSPEVRQSVKAVIARRIMQLERLKGLL